MKLHLPTSLRKALLALFVGTCAMGGATQAAIMHASGSLLTYTDFGSNMGRYSVYQVNDLLKHLNKDGVSIMFQQGEKDYTLPHGMISYESAVDGGPFTAIGYNVTATVQHNGVPNPAFTGRFIGNDNAIHYAGIEYRSCTDNAFLLTPSIDYKITRSSKLFTDITPTSVYDTAAHLRNGESVKGMLQYRMGGGYMQQADPDGNTQWLREAYVYVVGGIVVNTGFSYETGFDYVTETGTVTDGRGTVDDSYTIRITGVNGFGPGTAGTETHPLPFVTQGGDSGSPVWVWDTFSKSYQLISCHQARGGYNSYSRGASTWTMETLESFCKHVDMDKAEHTVHIGDVAEREGLSQTIKATANGSTPVETTTKYGYVSSDAADFKSVAFCGVQNGINTWLNLNTLKDTQKWYAYGNDFLNATNTNSRELQYADLFETENLVFESAGSHNSIILDADVDMGIGYVQFSAKQDSEEKGEVSYTISSADTDKGRDYMLNSAGYLVDRNVAVHVQLANTEQADGAAYVREWRKTGDGDLYLEGSGNNEIFLNVGGKGTTYLQEKGGYAAYNVIINNGSTVNLNGDTTQVARDVTFGYGGGVLDFAGDVTMDWHSGENNAVAADGFTINALTQDAVLTNTKAGSRTTLTYRTAGETTFLGSFRDGEGSGALRVIFDGGAGSAWTLNSIHTDLRNADSGLTVAGGSVTLAGTLTEHAQGSLTGYNQQRYSHEDDWHYADAKMNVDVASGATFCLGSHARLKGDVTVKNGGTFVMNEGVRHQEEYIEGWYRLENTYDIKEYYGLHGDVALNGTDAQMKVSFSEKTDADTELTGSITGTGSMVVETTAQGSLTLSGTNTFSGGKELNDGVLILKGTQAAGDVRDNKWVVGETAWLAVDGATATEALGVVDHASSGVLALTQNENGAPISLAGHDNLMLGAKEGTVIQFGREEGEENSYDAVNGTWKLGGGGGELVVNYALKDNADLVLGNQYTTGIVTLTNTANDIASIRFAGQVTLSYTDTKALGNAHINLSYTNRIMGATDTIDLLDAGADGVLLLDRMGDVGTIDLSGHHSLHLGAEGEASFGGDILLGNNTYYFGGITGHLTLTKALGDQNDGHTSLVLDGQTYHGGVLELTEAATLTGTVSIKGEDEGRTQKGGTTTLRLSANEALQSASFIMVYKGGALDINGTEQTISSLWMNEGSSIVDSSASRSGVLTLNNDRFLMMDEATIDVGTLIATGRGSIPISLGGVSTYDQFLIREGEVTVTHNQALCATGLTVVEKGAKLSTSSAQVTTQLVLNGGELAVGDSSKSGGNFGGAIVAAHKESASSLNIVGDATISAVVDVAEGATLNVTADGRKASFAAGVLNDSGGTINVSAPEMSLRSTDGTTIGGHLNLQGEAGEMTLVSETAADNMQREFNHLNLAKDLQLTLAERSRNTIWNIHHLSGSGAMTWNANTVHWYSSRMVLDGSNSFDGTLTVQRTTADKTENGRLYGTFAELAHDEALQHATLILNGLETAEGKSVVTLAVNTDNAKLRGLSGNEQSAIYAGASVEGDAVDAAPLKTAPISVRQATLTITGAGTQDFRGNVYGVNEGNGLTLVMDHAAGTQTFSGAEVSVLNAVAKQGRLELTSDHLNIAEAATIYRGATLSTGAAFSLDEAKTLAITGEGSQAARLDSALTLNGGVLSFDGSTLRTDAAALTVNSLNPNGHQELTIAFTSVAALQTGVTYKLADGQDWDSLSYTASGLDYLEATFGQESGLNVTFNAKDGSLIWRGTAEQTQWNDTSFGTDSADGIENGTAIFNDLSASRNVIVEGARSAQTLLFDNTADYVLDTSQQGASLQTKDIVLSGTSGVKLGAAVRSTGDVSIGAGSTLIVQGGDTLSDAQSVSGEGTLLVDLGENGQGALGAQVNELNRMEIVSGTLTADATLGAAALKIHEGATLRSSAGDVTSAASVQLAGTLEMMVDNGLTSTLTTAISAGEKAQTEEGRDTKGTLVKSGGGRLSVRADIAADTVRVEGGQLRVEVDAQIESFLTHVDRLEVQKGAQTYIGHNACNINEASYVTDMVVDGGTLELAAAQRYTDTVSGDVQVVNGGKLSKIDGGLRFTGAVQLGAAVDDRVTLYGNWGKGGMIFEGLVSGEGTVQLTHGGQGVETYTFSGNGNTFNGTYEVAQGVRLLAKAEQSIAAAESIDLKGGSLVLGHADVSLQELLGTATATIVTEKVGDTSTLTVTKGGTYDGSIGAGISLVKQGSGTLELTGFSGDFNGSVTVQNGTLSIGTETAPALLSHASELSISSGAALQLGSAVTISTESGEKAVADGAVSFIADGATASITGDGTTRLEHANIDLAAGTTLHLQDMVLAGSSRITDDLAVVALNNVSVEAILSRNATLAPAPDSRDGDAPQDHLTAGILTLSNIENVTLTGEKMTIKLSGITLESLSDSYDEVAIVLGGTESAASFSSGLDVAVTVGGSTANAYYHDNDYRVAYIDTASFATPEPATATLSLLALACLSARRRRR